MGTPLVNIGLNLGLANIEKIHTVDKNNSHLYNVKLHQISVIYVQRNSMSF